MKEETRRQVVVLVVVAVVGGGALLLWGGGGGRGPAPGGVQQIVTVRPIPPGTAVPGTDSAVPGNVAKPRLVQSASPGSSIDYRDLGEIRVENNTFSPDTIIVRQGDVAHMNFLAVDKDYDFTQPDYGMSGALPKGQKKLVEFQAVTTGKFTFYCSRCGGPTRGPVGYIVVVPR